jgi:Protein of unknown function (DUF3047)
MSVKLPTPDCRTSARCIVIAIVIVAIGITPLAQADQVVFSTDFSSLAGWREVSIPDVARAGISISEPPAGRALLLRSDNSAMALMLEQEFASSEVLAVRWRWRVRALPPVNDPSARNGDDYAIRVMFLFRDPPSGIGRLFQSMLGEDLLPEGSIHYVWSSRPFPDRAVMSPYTKRVYMIAVESGLPATASSAWREAVVRPYEDYQRLFGSSPPEKLRIGVMIDTDDSDSQGEAEITALELLRSVPEATP